jgi:hypothetical protein
MAAARAVRRIRRRRGCRADVSTPDEVRAETGLEIVTRIVTDWENVEDADGFPLPCTPDNVRRVCTDLPAFREAIITAVIEASRACGEPPVSLLAEGER